MAIRKLRDLVKPAPETAPPVLPSEADLDAVAEEQKAKEATSGSPLSTPHATPDVPEQTADHGFAPAPVAGPVSRLTLSDKVVWSDPELDTTKKDSLGNVKTDAGPFGPKGDNPPADVQTDAQRQAASDAKEARMREHMASTVTVDSVGNKKGHFEVTERGEDSHGARIPDVVDYSKPVEPLPVHVGPRGQGAPADTFHGTRPVKK